MHSSCLKEIKLGVGLYVKYVKYVKHERPCWTTFPNINRRVENTTRSAEYFDELREKFGNGVKHCRVCDISIFSTEIRNKKKTEK